MTIHNFKPLYILPNLFTLGSVFCGMYAIINASSAIGSYALYQSALAVFLAGFLDMCDGRVARMTKTESDFGVELDSLADAVSFGVAPAVIVYKWALWPLGLLGLFISFSFCAAGLVRLARFNVLAHRGENPKNYFQGMPIPIAAATLVMLVIAHFKLFGGHEVTRHLLVASLVVALGLMMVTKIKFQSFKSVKPDASFFAVFLMGFGGVLALSFYFPVSVILLLLIGTYIAEGFVREIYWKITGKGPQ